MAGSISSYRGQGSAAGSFAGLRRFFRWWGRELAALVPARLRPSPRPAGKFLWVEFTPTTAIIRRVAGQRMAEIGQVELLTSDPAARKLAFNALLGRHGRQALGLCVPSDQVLRKKVSLPLLARDNLRQVLSFELSRHTPFNAEHAWFDYRLTASDAKKGSLEVELTVAARRQIDESLAQLREWGRAPLAVVPKDDLLGATRYANLLPPHLLPRMPLVVKLALALAALLPILLLAVALAIPLWQKHEVTLALDAEVNKAKRAAAVIDGLKQELETVGGEYQYLLERKFKWPAAVAVVEEVTRLLPDDTWLSQMEIKGDEVVMSGETNSSSRLVRVMEKSTLMQDAGFRSPLVKGRDNVERFQLAAKLKETSLADALAGQRAEAAAKASGKKRAGKGERS